jgi:hypothetical protein
MKLKTIFLVAFIAVIAVSCFIKPADALPNLTAWASDVTSDTMLYGTNYAFNITVQGVNNHSKDNITACTFDGNAMSNVSALGNGSGSWTITVPAATILDAKNCSKNLSISCTVNNATAYYITASNATMRILPCIWSRTNTSKVLSASATNETVTINFDGVVNVLRTKVNNTALNSTDMLFCNSTFETGPNNVSLLLAETSINSTYANCQYEAIQVNDTAIKIQVAASLGAAPPNQPISLTNIIIVIAGAGTAGAMAYRYIRRRKAV